MQRLPQSRVVFLLAAVCLTVMAQSANGDWIFTHGGHTYEVVTTARNWSSAAADAVDREMYGVSGALARIDDQAENDAIFGELLSGIPTGDYSSTKPIDGGNASYVWIGATDQLSEGNWLWDGNNDGTGDQFWAGGQFGGAVLGRYHNWGRPTEPDDYQYLGTGQDAAGIALNTWPYGVAGQWNDVKGTNNLYYLVEFNAVPEPTSLALLCSGALFGLVWFVRSRRKK